MAEFEALRESSAAPFAAPRQGGGAGRRPMTGQPAVPAYASAGAFFVDHLATLRHKNNELAGIFGPRQEAAAARINAIRDSEAFQRAANQLTTDTPGILPVPVVGPVLNTIDASRPLVSSLGPKDMGNIPGTKFQRPHITQHATSGKQSAEKTALPSQPMKILPLEFLKETHGGWVNISRQDIDWTSPDGVGHPHPGPGRRVRGGHRDRDARPRSPARPA